MGSEKEVGIEGRVLAHEDRVKAFSVLPSVRAEYGMFTLHLSHRELGRTCGQCAVADG